MAVPLLLGIMIKKTPDWAAWSTVVIGGFCSYPIKTVITADWANNFWELDPELGHRQSKDYTFVTGVLLNISVCSTWFILTSIWYKGDKEKRATQKNTFFENIDTPVKKDGKKWHLIDATQEIIVGILALAYGVFVLFLILIPNPIEGGLAFGVYAIIPLGVGGFLYKAGQARKKRYLGSDSSEIVNPYEALDEDTEDSTTEKGERPTNG